MNENDHCFFSLQDLEIKYDIKINPLEFNSVLRAIKGNFRYIFQANAEQMFIRRPFCPILPEFNFEREERLQTS